MIDIKKNKSGYLVNAKTGRKVVFYVCDPSKNTECDKKQCRARIPEGMGFCASTLDPKYQAEGTRPFYKLLNEEGYFGREYIGEEASES